MTEINEWLRISYESSRISYEAYDYGHQLVDNTVCPYITNQSTDHYQIFSSCYFCQIKARLIISFHLHMGNYVNQVHHTINTGESREVKIKINFA